jgi:hypothetical protein
MNNHPNTAIARAEDVLAEARNWINCIFLAAANLGAKKPARSSTSPVSRAPRLMRRLPCWTNTAMAKPHHIRRIRKLRKETCFRQTLEPYPPFAVARNGKRLSEAPSVFGNRRRGHVLRLALHNTKGCREMSAMIHTMIISPARR